MRRGMSCRRRRFTPPVARREAILATGPAATALTGPDITGWTPLRGFTDSFSAAKNSGRFRCVVYRTRWHVPDLAKMDDPIARTDIEFDGVGISRFMALR
jgi:hypothetical protein